MKVLQLGELFALPLQSAIRAQNLALLETISVLEKIGMERGEARNFRMKAERLIEERDVDPDTGKTETRFTAQPFEISIPLLALISPPSLHLQEMNVEFGVAIVEPRAEAIQTESTRPQTKASSLAGTLSHYSALNQPGTTTMKVNMKIVRETSEGMARLGDLLADLLNARSKVNQKPPEPKGE
jgi:hypothetical protein